MYNFFYFKGMKKIFSILILLIVPFAGLTQDLFRTTMVRAAPGKLLELIDVVKKKASDSKQDLYLLRHSQGDHWDLMLIELTDEYNESGLLSTKGNRGILDDPMDHLISWKEEMYVTGPSHRNFRREFDDAGFFHI